MTPTEIGLGLALFGTITSGIGLKAGIWTARRDLAKHENLPDNSVKKDVCRETHIGLNALMKSQHKEVLARLDKMNGSGR